MPKFLDAVKGFGVTFSTMFKKPITEQYPEKPGPVAPRYHGRHQLNRYPDGLEKCIGCELCAWACPRRRHLCRGRRQHRRRTVLPGERFTAASTRSTICAASAAGCVSRHVRQER